MKYLILLIPLIGVIGLVWSILALSKKAAKDWAVLEDLEKRAQELPMKKEAIEEFYNEFTVKASKINNKFIVPRLKGIEGYLKGVYKTLNNDGRKTYNKG